MAIQWITTRENYDGMERVSESRIHYMYTETVTACGRVIDTEYMKMIAEDCDWSITDIRLIEYPDSSVTCHLCLRATRNKSKSQSRAGQE